MKIYDICVTVGKSKKYFDRHNVMEGSVEEYREFISGLYNGRATLNFEIVGIEELIDNDKTWTRRAWQNGAFRTVYGQTRTIR